ncbi:MAG TPA: hypothetical protein VN730_15070 [Steroidobacteraceae bacterium]|nr:hypothetical protein [Steroidobacteraceae bacterium]
MSELVLIAADIFAAASDVPQRARGLALPLLSHIARYGTVEPLPAGWRAWLAGWLGREELASAAPASIAGAAMRAPGEPQRQFLWLADPVHLIVGPTSVHLSPNGTLALDAAAQQALAAAFDFTFARSGYALEPLRGGRFLLSGPAPSGEVRAMEPARALGTRIADPLPRGRGASALRALGAEIEMWLHEHPLNVRRVRENRPPISTLWLWGGGAPLGADAWRSGNGSPSAAVFGDDGFMEGLARLCGAHFAAEAPAPGALAGAGAPRRIVALELLRSAESPPQREPLAAFSPLAALEQFERQWVAPALEQLKAGDLTRLTILVNDRALAFGARDRFKLWRRPRAAFAELR